MEKILISNEDEAIELLAKLVDGHKLNESMSIEFDSWPKFTIRIQGDDFKGTIPTRIMPTLLDLQKEVHRVYCLTTYGDENLRRLTKKDREQLELVVKIEDGSSIFETLLEEPILKTIQDASSKMSPEQITATLIIFGLSVTSVIFWKLWLSNRIKEKELDQTVDLSKLEKEKMEVVKNAMQQFPTGQAAAEGSNELRNSVLMKLKPSDSLEISNPQTSNEPSPVPVNISGDMAEQITHTPREKAIERMITDEFFLRSADFSRSDGVRIEVQRVADNYSFRADVPLGVLGDDQAESLKNNSWNKTNVTMSMLVKELHGRYTSAKVISVKAKKET